MMKALSKVVSKLHLMPKKGAPTKESSKSRG